MQKHKALLQGLILRGWQFEASPLANHPKPYVWHPKTIGFWHENLGFFVVLRGFGGPKRCLRTAAGLVALGPGTLQAEVSAGAGTWSQAEWMFGGPEFFFFDFSDFFGVGLGVRIF